MTYEKRARWSDLDQYQTSAARTRNFKDVVGALLGLAGETGEVCELLKKHLYHGQNFSHKELVEELGDILWYLSQVADLMGIFLSEVAEANLQKLKKRHPNGFDPSYHQEKGI